MSDATPISEVRYELRSTDLLDHILQQRARTEAVIKKLTGKWDLFRRAALLSTIVVLLCHKDLAARVGPNVAMGIALVLVAATFYASRQIKKQIRSTGAQAAPQPKWLVKRVFKQRLFKNSDVLQGSVSFYQDRMTIQQGDAQLESAYEDDKIDLIALDSTYLEIVPSARQDVADALFFIPVKDIVDNRDELFALLREKSAFMAI